MRHHSYPIRSKAVLAVSALAVALFSAPARAQRAASSEAATAQSNADPAARFAQAVKLFKASRLAEALPIFEQLFTDTGSPNAALYVGHCLSGLERNAEAYDAYSRAVRAAAQDPKYEQAREAAQAQLSALGVRVAKLVLSLTETPEGVRVSVDDKPVELAMLGSPIALEPGVHAVVVEAEGREPSKREVLIEAGETKTVTLSLDKKPSEEKTDPAPAPVAPPAQDLRPQLRLAGYVAGGVGALGFLTLTLAGLEAKSTNDSLARECSRGCSDREHLDAIDHGKTMQTLANVGLVIGAVGVAASGTLLFLGFSGGDESGPSASLSPFGAELGYRGRF